jgi:hypothetical protein
MTNKVAVLKGIGPNEIVIISMVFASLNDGIKFMDDVVDKFREIQVPSWRVKGEMVSAIQTQSKIAKNGNKSVIYDIHESLLGSTDEETHEILDKIFTSYYDGCGGVFNFIIEEAEFGVPLCGFNLD